MNLDLIASLQTDFGRIYDENFKLRDRNIYNIEIDRFNKKLSRAGISPKLSPKEIELKLQQIYETLMKLPKFQNANQPNDMPAKTTLNAAESADLIEKAEKLTKQNAEIKAREKQTVADFIKQNQERIAKAQAVQDKLKDKVVYAKVILPEPLPLDEIEKQDLDTLRASAQGDVSTKQKLIDDLAKQIETKLENVPEEQKVLIARTAAVEIVEKLAKPEKAYQAQIQNSILTVIHEDKGRVVSTVLNKDDELLIAAKNGSTLLELEYRNKNLITRNISKNILGLKLTSVICGPEQFEVVLSETKIEGQTTHQVDFEGLNQSYLRLLEKQNSILNSAKEFKFDGEQNFFTEQARTYISEKKADIPPKGISKRSHSKHGEIFARHGLPNTIVLNTTKNVGRFGELLIKISPNTTSPLLSIAGRIAENEFIKPVVGLFTKGVVVGTGAGGIATTIATTIGVATSWVTVGLSLIGAFIVKKISDKGPQTKKWIDNNKMLIGLGTSLGVMGFFGPVPAIITGGLFLTATGTLNSFVSGALGMLSVVGMSIGMSIATPVIIAVVALVPLVAFIMLVINNSAYIVPPSISTLLQNQDNLYVEVTKNAEPAGPFENSDLPLKIKYTITVKARKSMLTNISFNHECKVVQENNSQDCVAPVEAPPTSISPASPYVYIYEANYNSSYIDALVINTFTVTADAGENTLQTSSGNATITIGEPPAKCLQIDGAWPNSAKTNVEKAKGKLVSEFPTYVAKVCAEYPNGLPLRYEGAGNDNYWGWFKGSHILFYPKGVKSFDDATYTLAHELVHALVAEGNNFAIYLRYIATPGILSETPRCFYSYNPMFLEERLAETVAFTVIKPRCGNPQQQWPKHYNFVQQNVLK